MVQNDTAPLLSSLPEINVATSKTKVPSTSLEHKSPIELDRRKEVSNPKALNSSSDIILSNTITQDVNKTAGSFHTQEGCDQISSSSVKDIDVSKKIMESVISVNNNNVEPNLGSDKIMFPDNSNEVAPKTTADCSNVIDEERRTALEDDDDDDIFSGTFMVKKTPNTRQYTRKSLKTSSIPPQCCFLDFEDFERILNATSLDPPSVIVNYNYVNYVLNERGEVVQGPDCKVRLKDIDKVYDLTGGVVNVRTLGLSPDDPEEGDKPVKRKRGRPRKDPNAPPKKPPQPKRKPANGTRLFRSRQPRKPSDPHNDKTDSSEDLSTPDDLTTEPTSDRDPKPKREIQNNFTKLNYPIPDLITDVIKASSKGDVEDWNKTYRHETVQKESLRGKTKGCSQILRVDYTHNSTINRENIKLPHQRLSMSVKNNLAKDTLGNSTFNKITKSSDVVLKDLQVKLEKLNYEKIKEVLHKTSLRVGWIPESIESELSLKCKPHTRRKEYVSAEKSEESVKTSNPSIVASVHDSLTVQRRPKPSDLGNVLVRAGRSNDLNSNLKEKTFARISKNDKGKRSDLVIHPFNNYKSNKYHFKRRFKIKVIKQKNWRTESKAGKVLTMRRNEPTIRLGHKNIPMFKKKGRIGLKIGVNLRPQDRLRKVIMTNGNRIQLKDTRSGFRGRNSRKLKQSWYKEGTENLRKKNVLDVILSVTDKEYHLVKGLGKISDGHGSPISGQGYESDQTNDNALNFSESPTTSIEGTCFRSEFNTNIPKIKPHIINEAQYSQDNIRNSREVPLGFTSLQAPSSSSESFFSSDKDLESYSSFDPLGLEFRKYSDKPGPNSGAEKIKNLLFSKKAQKKAQEKESVRKPAVVDEHVILELPGISDLNMIYQPPDELGTGGGRKNTAGSNFFSETDYANFENMVNEERKKDSNLKMMAGLISQTRNVLSEAQKELDEQLGEAREGGESNGEKSSPSGSPFRGFETTPCTCLETDFSQPCNDPQHRKIHSLRTLALHREQAARAAQQTYITLSASKTCTVDCLHSHNIPDLNILIPSGGVVNQKITYCQSGQLNSNLRGASVVVNQERLTGCRRIDERRLKKRLLPNTMSTRTAVDSIEGDASFEFPFTEDEEFLALDQLEQNLEKPLDIRLTSEIQVRLIISFKYIYFFKNYIIL
jgi:hypothetical protein